MSRPIHWLSILALLAPLGARAQTDDGEAPPPPPVEEIHEATTEDLEEFRAAYERFGERVEEMRGELKRIVTHRYQEEVKKIRSSYEAQIEENEVIEQERRLEAIRQHEAFIAKYPRSPYTAHRMFRLADLYLEEMEFQFLVDSQEYHKLEDLFDAGEIKSLPEPPGYNYANSIALYKRLIRDFPDYEYLDATYYLLGYSYGDELSEQRDDALALETYSELVTQLPESRYAANGWFQLGEIYFDELRFDDAIVAYENVMKSGVEDLFDRSLYKLAWAFYRKDDLANAIPRFVQLIDHSDSMELTEGKAASQLRPESIKYLAISLVDQADDVEMPPILRAESFFTTGDDKAYEYDVLVQVDDVLWQQGRYDEEIQALERIVARFPNSPDNPDFMHKIMQLHYLKDNPDADAAQDTRTQLVELFREGTPWWEANKSNPDALRAASKYIEESLLDVAKLYHATAYRQFGDSGGVPGSEPARSEYLKAAAAYQDYLDRFPFAADAYETQYQIADCYYFAAEYERAIHEYHELDKYPDKSHHSDALDALAFSYERLMEDREGDYKGNPLSLMNQEIPPGQKPESVAKMEISPLRKAFIEAVDALYVDAPAHEDMPRKLFIVAEIYLFHNELDEARKRLQDIVDRWPTLSFAAYATGYIIDSYSQMGDLETVYALADQYRKIEMMGEDEAYWTEKRLPFFEGIKEDAQFMLAMRAGESGDIESFKTSGQAFEEFYREYPESEEAATSLYNAARQYENGGDTVNSNRLYEEFLEKFAEHEKAPAIFFRIAGQYERTMELDRAIGYYTQVARLHEDYEKASDAYWQSAFLSLGLKRYDDAGRYYLKYAADFEVEDADEAYWRAAEAYRDGGLKKKALKTYNDYIDRFGDKDANRTMEALIKVAQLYGEQGNRRQETATKERLLAQYHATVAAGTQLTRPAVAAAAEVAFPELQAAVDAYAAIKLPNSWDQEELRPVLEEKQAGFKSIQEQANAFMATYAHFDYIMASLYIKADVVQLYVEMIYAWTPPYDRLMFGPPNEDKKIMYEELLDEQKIALAEAYEIEAVKLYELVLAKASELKQNSPWVERAREALNKTDPNTYPLLKPDRVRYDNAPYEADPSPAVAPAKETS